MDESCSVFAKVLVNAEWIHQSEGEVRTEDYVASRCGLWGTQCQNHNGFDGICVLPVHRLEFDVGFKQLHCHI